MNSEIAVLCSDIHLSHTPPAARSAEPDWYAAMQRSLDEVARLAKRYECPIICAGDVFDRWNSPPELINWAADHMPKMYAIPGQHDLPEHAYEQIKRSAYWSLVEMGVIENCAGVTKISPALTINALPWGWELQPCERKFEGVSLAVVHKYVWKPNYGYLGSPDDARIEGVRRQLKGYDALMFGDNHKGFLAGSSVLNCGCLIRRKQAERRYKPCVGLLMDDGSIYRQYLDCSADKWLTVVEEKEEQNHPELEKFLERLGTVATDLVDFRGAILRLMDDNRVSGGARQILLEALGEGDMK